MLKMSLLEASWVHLVAQAPKWSKIVFWGPPGAIWSPRHQNAQNEHFGAFLGPFGGPGTKILKMDLLGAALGVFGEAMGGLGKALRISGG
jgi:hypothetical protein